MDCNYRELLSEEEHSFLLDTRSFMEREIAPFAEQIDRDDEVPQEVFEVLKPYLYLTVPKEYGGKGHEEIYDCIAVQELGAVCPALVTYLEVAQLFGRALMIAGTEEQKHRYLPRFGQGKVGAYALTDLTPGSDPAGMTTVAHREGKGWRIRGTKRFITFADIADMMVVFARTPDEGGVSAFVIEQPYEGIEFIRRNEWSGLRGHKAWEFSLDVYTEQIVGRPGEGLSLALKVLNFTRTSLACGHVGLATSALDLAIRFAKERVVGGQPIFRHQSISYAIVEAKARVEGARLLAYRAARMSEHGVDHRAETSMAKFAAAEALIEAASTANRVLGGYACNLDTPAERYLRDAFTWVSAHGTIEIQKMTVSRSIFSGR